MAHVVERFHPELSYGELLCGLRSLDNTLRQPDAEAPVERDLGSTMMVAHAACVGQFEARPVADVAEPTRSVGLPLDRIVSAITVTPTKGEPR